MTTHHYDDHTDTHSSTGVSQSSEFISVGDGCGPSVVEQNANSEKIELFPQQQEAFELLCDFLHSEDSVFILKGYAGTGKTTLIKSLLPVIKSIGKMAFLLAPTGRAANILGVKTDQEASTIHRRIYSSSEIKSIRHDEDGNLIETYKTKENDKNHKNDSVEYWYQIAKFPDDGYLPSQRVIIVDEASMISSRPAMHEIFHFGTDVLLDDLLTYARLGDKTKIIFIGDPAQLPPVGDNQSLALDEIFFSGRGWKTHSFELTDVVRQSSGSAILENAMKIRNVLNSDKRNELTFARRDDEFEELSSSATITKYTDMFPTPTINQSVIICYSNNMVKAYNDAIRDIYYPGKTALQVGDILQVVKNCYNIDPPLYNGDFVQVLEVSDAVEQQSAKVWTSEEGVRQHQLITLTFRDVDVISQSGDVYRIKIIDSLLDSRAAQLSHTEAIALYINFRMRHPDLKPKDEAMMKELMSDPYYNALHVKYGYAITGHKSQGGDWDVAFVDYTDRNGLNNDCLRWAYTATTRAKKTLYGINMPDIHPFSKLKISKTIKAGKPAQNAFAVGNVGNVEMLPTDASNARKAKALSVASALSQYMYSIVQIESLQYKDRYHIATPDGIEKYDCQYNGSGLYTMYQSLSPVSRAHSEKILQALQSEEAYIYRFEYQPSTELLSRLYSKVRSVCDELGITITNIVEDSKQFNVIYHLKTSGKFASLKIFFDKKQFLTYAQPSSDLGAEDALLNELLTKIG